MNRVFLGVAAVVAGLSGCAAPARYVERGADSGIVAIPANTNAWPTYNRREAVALIEQHVGANFEIVEEREVPVGKTTVNNQQVNNEETWNTQNPFLPANKQTIQNTTTTRDVTEFRIAYRRKAGTLGGPVLPGAAAAVPGMPIPAAGVQPAGFGGAAGGVRPAGGAMPTGGPGVTNAGGALGGPARSGPGFEANAGAFIPVGGR